MRPTPNGRSITRTLVAAWMFVAVASASSQVGSGGTITDGDAVFTMAPGPNVNTGNGAASADLRLTGPTGPDNLYQSWWWYRVNGSDTREYCLSNATAWNWGGDMGAMDFTTASFTAHATWRVSNSGPNTARVTASLTVNNTTGTPIDLAIFHYQDFDFAGTPSSDSASLVMPDIIQLSEPGAGAPYNTLLAFYRATDPDAYQVTSWAALRGLFTNTTINNLDNSGLPFGPGDWTGAFQFNRMIPAGESATVHVDFGLGANIPPDTCPGDFNNSGTATVQDIFDFLIAYFAQSPAADVNGQGGVTVQDIFDFLIAYFAGCP